MRLGELLSLTWDEVDLSKSIMRKEQTKNGEGRIIPLTKKALTTIAGLPRAIHTDRVFSTFPHIAIQSKTVGMRRRVQQG